MSRFIRQTRPQRLPLAPVARPGNATSPHLLVDYARPNRPIEYVPIGELLPPERETRVHSERQLARLEVGVRAYGNIVPILIDAEGRIICGVARVEVARRLGHVSVPALRITHLSRAQLKAFRLFENRISEDAKWDVAELRLEFEEILEIEPGFTVEPLTAFSVAEIDMILDGDGDADADAADQDGIELQRVTVSRIGDLWAIGNHRLLCGDAKSADSYAALHCGETVHQIVSDLPYNVRITNNVSGLGKVKHGEFVEASGEKSSDEFRGFMVSSITAMGAPLKPGGILHLFMDWRSSHLLVSAGQECGLELTNICVWDKGSGANGSFYRSQHEFIHVFRKPGGKHTNNIELGRHGRYRTNVWSVPGLNRFSRERQELLSLHSTVKPVRLITEAIKDCSLRGEIIADPFCGSGTMLIAAEITGRIARCMELDPAYVDVAIRRFEKRFGVEAVHAVTGRTFSEEARFRAAEAMVPDAPPQPLPRRRRPPV